MDHDVPVTHRVKMKEKKKIDKYFDLVKKLKRSIAQESDDDTNCNRSTRDSNHWFEKDTEVKGDQRNNRDNTDYRTIKKQLESWEESWRPQEICCHSALIEKLAIKIGIKK